MKRILCLALLWSSFTFAQSALDVAELEIHRPMGSPFGLPVSVSSSGEVSFFGNDEMSDFSFAPIMQIGVSMTSIHYVQPIISNKLKLIDVNGNLGWVEIRNLRYEIGAGLAVLIKNTVNLGLIPYKGALQAEVRFKKKKDDEVPLVIMPKKLSTLKKWNLGDSGIYQTYGGVQLHAQAGMYGVSVGSVTVGFQNQFVVSLSKIDENRVMFTLSEGNLNRAQISLGVSLSRVHAAQLNGKRFTAQFILDLNNPEHHDLYEQGLKGNITELQSRLPSEDQQMTWKGSEGSSYYGIPWVIGQTYARGHYEMDQEGVEAELDIKIHRNSGTLKPLMNHRKYIYQTESNLVLLWSSEMNKATGVKVEKNFLVPGRVMGIQGFPKEIPESKLGSVVTNIGLSFTKNEIDSFNQADANEIADSFKERCDSYNLSCSQVRTQKSILSKFTKILKMPWKEKRGELGVLLMKEPALIYSLIKTAGLKKEAYFKFLSEKYQSIEGNSPIEI